MSLAEIEKMPIKERIILMEGIWNSLRKDIAKIESPEWHGEILTNRQKRINEGNATYIPIDDLRTRSK